jgi:hypothetical protein
MKIWVPGLAGLAGYRFDLKTINFDVQNALSSLNASPSVRGA